MKQQITSLEQENTQLKAKLKSATERPDHPRQAQLGHRASGMHLWGVSGQEEVEEELRLPEPGCGALFGQTAEARMSCTSGGVGRGGSFLQAAMLRRATSEPDLLERSPWTMGEMQVTPGGGAAE